MPPRVPITDGGGTGSDGDARYAREVAALRLAARATRPAVAPAVSNELAYLRIGFPTCWCAMSVTAAPLAEAEYIYRATWRSLTGTPGSASSTGSTWSPA